MVLVVIFVFMVLLGSGTLMYQIYQMVVLDAKSRGLKHPRLWGFFSLGGGNNGGGGLVLYLIGRNRFPSSMTDSTRKILDSRKKRSGVSLCFMAVGAVGLLFIALFGNLSYF